MIKMNWKKMLVTIASLVLASLLIAALLTLLIELLQTVFGIDERLYLAALVTVFSDIAKTAIGVYLGLLFFLPVVHQYLGQDKAQGHPAQEAAD